MKRYLPIFIYLFACSLSLRTWANNLEIKINSIEQINANRYLVDLSVVWENSWNEVNGAQNHDASWLFLKQKILNSPAWNTSKIYNVHSNDYDFSLSEDSIGVIIESNCTSFSKKSVGIVLLEVSCSSDFQLFVGGIELVFVPEGAFYIGDNVSINRLESALSEPILVQSENALKYGDAISSSTWASVVGDIPNAFPKGFGAFYCMKYEVSQIQFVDFVNHVSFSEQSKILSKSPSSVKGTKALAIGTNAYFNGIVVAESGVEALQKPAVLGCDLNSNSMYNEAKDGKELACNFLSWQQTLYYLDWVGLRPMTEFEFEKAARGFSLPVEREFSFGTVSIQDANVLVFDSTEFETYSYNLLINQGIGAHGYSGRQGPLRVGFAAKDTTNRLGSGASYWGILELSGNLWEQTMGVNKANGLLFQGSHGDGDLESLPGDWLSESMMLRGGAWNSGISSTYRDLAVSDRYYYNLADESARNTTGARGVVSLKHLKP